YCEYLRLYNSRDVVKDIELVASAISEYSGVGLEIEWGQVFRLVHPPFDAIRKNLSMMHSDHNQSAIFLKQFGACLAELYPNELAQYFFEHLNVIGPFVEHVPYLISSTQIQQQMALLFLSQEQLDWERITRLMSQYSALFSELIKTILENVSRDTLQQLCGHITTTILTDQNLEMMNDYIGIFNNISKNDQERTTSDKELVTLESCNHSISNETIFETAAVLMYCGKMGIHHLFQFIAEQRKDVIDKFPQVFPMVYHSITDMGNIEKVNLRREFHLVSHSTEILLFISRHSILKKYLNLLASIWSIPSSSMQNNCPSFFKAITSIHFHLDRISVLKEYSLSEKDIFEMISLYVSKNAMGKFSNLFHLPTFTMNHLLQIPNLYLFHTKTFNKIASLRLVVDLLWNNFEKDQAKIKFRDLFCFIHGHLYQNKHLTQVMKYYKGKYLEMVEEIMYDMLLDNDKYLIICFFVSNLSDTSISLTDELKLECSKELCGGHEFEEPNFELRDFDRLKRVLCEKSKSTISKQHFDSWKTLILSIINVEQADNVSRLLNEIDPILKNQKELQQQYFKIPTVYETKLRDEEEREKKEIRLSQSSSLDLSKISFSFGNFSSTNSNLFEKFASIKEDSQEEQESTATSFSMLNIQFKN
ncbi:hypothetical protein C9374_012925, partial [Naegleria lovaniensis]